MLLAPIPVENDPADPLPILQLGSLRCCCESSGDEHRRKFISLLGSTTAAWPFTTRAQRPGGMRRIVVLMGNAGRLDRARAYATELATLAPDAVLANGTQVLSALHRATRSIPIVFVVVADPVGAGFVQDLAHPGGNITGFSTFEHGMESAGSAHSPSSIHFVVHEHDHVG